MNSPRVCLLAAGAVLALWVGCSKSPAKGKDLHTHGTIKSINVQERKLVLQEKQPGATSNEVVKVERTYKVAFDCSIATPAKGQAELADLQTGHKIKIRYNKELNELVIHKIAPHVSELTPATPPAK